MVVSPGGRAKIARREGTVLKAYQDSVGVWTIGVGHTGWASPPLVKRGMVIDAATSDQYLARDLKVFENAVNGAIKLPMTQNQFDAMVSLAFNIGAAGFRGSSVVRQFNLGHTHSAADDFLMWDIPHTLLARRSGEREQFLS